jgi:hypothetical protein
MDDPAAQGMPWHVFVLTLIPVKLTLHRQFQSDNSTVIVTQEVVSISSLHPVVAIVHSVQQFISNTHACCDLQARRHSPSALHPASQTCC